MSDKNQVLTELRFLHIALDTRVVRVEDIGTAIEMIARGETDSILEALTRVCSLPEPVVNSMLRSSGVW